jgi:hypothetical protein
VRGWSTGGNVTPQEEVDRVKGGPSLLRRVIITLLPLQRQNNSSIIFLPLQRQNRFVSVTLLALLMPNKISAGLHHYHYWDSKNIVSVILFSLLRQNQKCIGYIVNVTEDVAARVCGSKMGAANKGGAAATGGAATGTAATEAAASGKASTEAANKGGVAATGTAATGGAATVAEAMWASAGVAATFCDVNVLELLRFDTLMFRNYYVVWCYVLSQ